MDDKYIGERVDPDEPVDNTPVDVARDSAIIHRHASRLAQRLIALGVQDIEVWDALNEMTTRAWKLRKYEPTGVTMPGFMQDWGKE